jgi:hypothetical protein
MANPHDPVVQQMIEQAAQQQQAQQMLQMVLQNTLRQPAVIKRAMISLMDVARSADGDCVLMVALPTGERWDIAVSAEAQRALSRAFAAQAAQSNGEIPQGD